MEIINDKTKYNIIHAIYNGRNQKEEVDINNLEESGYRIS